MKNESQWSSRRELWILRQQLFHTSLYMEMKRYEYRKNEHGRSVYLENENVR